VEVNLEEVGTKVIKADKDLKEEVSILLKRVMDVMVTINCHLEQYWYQDVMGLASK
jgi:hypothetical protein